MMIKLSCLLIKLDIVGWEETLLAVIFSKPPVFIREFLNICVGISKSVIHDVKQAHLPH